jgi:hypothetical protein
MANTWGFQIGRYFSSLPLGFISIEHTDAVSQLDLA